MTKEQIEKMDLMRFSRFVEDQLGTDPEFGNLKIREKQICGFPAGLSFEFVNTKPVDAGIFGKMCSRFQIVGFGSVTDYGLYIRIHFSYDHRGGGSNGIQIGSIRYILAEDEWSYTSV